MKRADFIKLAGATLVSLLAGIKGAAKASGIVAARKNILLHVGNQPEIIKRRIPNIAVVDQDYNRYWVDSRGAEEPNYKGDGTIKNPFATIQEAIDRLS